MKAFMKNNQETRMVFAKKEDWESFEEFKRHVTLEAASKGFELIWVKP